MTSHVLASPLMDALARNDYQQKFIAGESKTPQATFSDHVTGKKAVTIQKAEQYAESINDSKFSLEMAYIFFGAVSAMTDILQQKESNERKAKKDRALEVLTLNDGTLSREDKDIILDYSMEFLDEIMVETTMLVSLLELCDVTVNRAVEKRMPYWQQRGYMRKGN
jgi:hypothetical protein